MRRHIMGIISASVAAPYLVLLMINVITVAHIIVTAPQRFDPFDLLNFITRGTEALVFLGLPIFLFATFVAFLLHAFEHKSRRDAVLAGAILGFLFGLAFSPEYQLHSVEFIIAMLSGIIPGAICGWIYWRIALRERPIDGGPESRQGAR